MSELAILSAMDPECELEPLQSSQEADTWRSFPWRSSRWRFVALGLVVVLGVVAVVVFGAKTEAPPARAARAPAHRWAPLGAWEDLPGIDAVIREAQELEPLEPVQLPTDWNLTECVIDAFQVMTYLGTAVVELYSAIHIQGARCPDDSPAGCAASVQGVFAAVAWVGAYISMSANACVAAGDTKATCSNDWLTFMSSLAEVGVAGAAVSEDCDFNKDWLKVLHITKEEEPGWKQFIPATAGPMVERAQKINKLNRAHEARDVSFTKCGLDVGNSLAYIVREVIQIQQAVNGCADPYNCAINILTVLASFGWIIRFGSVMAIDCTNDENQPVQCTSDIAEMFAGLVNLPASGMASVQDCVY